jgi:hypothetical protein
LTWFITYAPCDATAIDPRITKSRVALIFIIIF